MSSLQENLKPRPCRIHRTITRSILRGRGLRFSRKYRTFKVNKLFIIWLFALDLQARNRTVGITGEQCLRLTNQSARYVGWKHKPYNKYRNWPLPTWRFSGSVETDVEVNITNKNNIVKIQTSIPRSRPVPCLQRVIGFTEIKSI